MNNRTEITNTALKLYKSLRDRGVDHQTALVMVIEAVITICELENEEYPLTR